MKILIIRLSSLGDIVQSLSCVEELHKKHPDGEVHWVVRNDFYDFVKIHPLIHHIWKLEKKQGFWGLLKLSFQLRKQNFSHIYDAHNNLRSYVMSWILNFPFKNHIFLRRSKNRWKRFLLFQLRKNLFPKPFRGAFSFITPLQKKKILPKNIHLTSQLSWPLNLSQSLEPRSKKISQSVVLAPSAAWTLKRWPLDYWKTLIQQNPDQPFILLGGPADTFCEELVQINPNQVLNLAGKISWMESAQIVYQSRLTVSGDTGLLHIADLLGKPCIALIGPTAFGYPSRPTSKVLEVSIPCKPCTKDGRGRCHNSIYKKCLMDITPDQVTIALRGYLSC